MEKKYTVYKHTFPNGKVYIGVTKQKPEKRFKSNGAGYWYSNKSMYYAIKKYKWENVTTDFLFEGLTKKEAYEKEIELISFYDSTNKEKGYNQDLGGTKISESHRQKIKETQKKAAEISSKKVNQYSLDGVFIKEWPSVSSAAKTFKNPKSAETGISHACRKNSTSKQSLGFMWRYSHANIEPLKLKNLKVKQFSLNGVFISEFNGVKDAAQHIEKTQNKKYRSSYGRIWKACSGEIKYAHGFIWKYSRDLLNNNVVGSLAPKKEFVEPVVINKKIKQFSLDGIFIKEFDSIYDIIKENPSFSRDFIVSVSGKRKSNSAYGFMWRYSDECEGNNNIEPFKRKKVISTFGKKINQLSLDGKIVKTWNNIMEAARYIYPSGINAAYIRIGKRLRGKSKTKEAFGFLWEYAEDNGNLPEKVV